MARIQVVTAITLNGFLPEPAGTLVSWVRNDRRGFPFWRERCSALILPHSILDLLCEKDNRVDSFTYLAEIIEPESVELLRGLFLYDLVDELVVYQLPFSAGQGISVLNTFRPQHWELHKTTSFPTASAALSTANLARCNLHFAKNLAFCKTFSTSIFIRKIFISLYFNGMAMPFDEMHGHWYAISPICSITCCATRCKQNYYLR